MRTSGNTILITGGATGIGLALAESFLSSGNKVIICGRREHKLKEVQDRFPQLETRRCDISVKEERKQLFKWVESNFPATNILVNNAGIQRFIDLKKGPVDLLNNEDEIEINFTAPIELSAYFAEFLIKKEEAAIINVTSGLGFVPLAIFPVYCSTKAAMHSFTMSLRHQLKGTTVKVFEVIPPTVHDTELKGKPIDKTDYSVASSEVAQAVMKGIEADQYEIAVGTSNNWINGARSDLDKAFSNINRQ